MLTATAARRETVAAQRRIDRARLRTEVPKHMRGIQKEIKDAIVKGTHRAVFCVNYTTSDEAAQAIKARLAKRGFRCEVDYQHGTSDMGDFNAPCVVDWSSTDFIITWDKSLNPEKGCD